MNVMYYLALIFVSIIVAMVLASTVLYTLLLPVIVPIICIIKRVSVEAGTEIACKYYDAVGKMLDFLDDID